MGLSKENISNSLKYQDFIWEFYNWIFSIAEHLI